MDPLRRPSVIPNKDEYLDNAQTFNRTSKMFEEFLHSFEQHDKEEQHKRRDSSSLSDCVRYLAEEYMSNKVIFLLLHHL
ncbi:hypothetical protein ACI65C_006255 [Semiaphis heraclei]